MTGSDHQVPCSPAGLSAPRSPGTHSPPESEPDFPGLSPSGWGLCDGRIGEAGRHCSRPVSSFEHKTGTKTPATGEMCAVGLPHPSREWSFGA